MPDYWITETRTSRDEAGAVVVIGSDDPAYDGQVIRFEDAAKVNDWSGLESRLVSYLKGRGASGGIRAGGSTGSRRTL